MLVSLEMCVAQGALSGHILENKSMARCFHLSTDSKCFNLAAGDVCIMRVFAQDECVEEFV